MNELESILNYLETTSLEPHDDYTSEFTYKEQKMLWNYIKQLKEQLKQKEDIINKANEILTKEYKENVFEHYEYDLYKAVNTLKKLLEILDNKGE